MTTRLDGHSEGRNKFPDGFRILQGKQEFVTYLEHSSIRVWASDVAGHYDHHCHSAIEAIMPDRGVAVYQIQDELFPVRFCHEIFHRPADQADIAGIQAGDQAADIPPLADGVVHGHRLGKDASGDLGRDHDFRVGDGAIEIAGDGQLDDVEGFIAADQDDPSE